MNKLKSILGSKLFQLVFSAFLIFIAFRKVDVVSLFDDVRQVPLWVVVALLIYMGISMFIGGLRWSVLVFEKVRLKDVLAFTKATYAGSFYSLFFPSSVGGDLLKWTTLLKKYPDISKLKLAGTALIDRVIGFSAFVIAAMLAILAGKLLNYQFPDILFWIFLAISLVLIVFYILVFSLDFEKILGLTKHLWFSKYLNKLLKIVDLLKTGNKKRILISFLISMLAEPIWMLMTWFISLAFGAGINLLEVFIFMPIISLILVLPISWAGFGARENLFLIFFGQLGIAPEKLLLVSAFGGVLGILNALLGGLILLF
ncbi:MAG: lysylphosphatidylglycerol synthase transmembrane domain-containing protein [Candidatus Shapirobacteria bacterium]